MFPNPETVCKCNSVTDESPRNWPNNAGHCVALPKPFPLRKGGEKATKHSTFLVSDAESRGRLLSLLVSAFQYVGLQPYFSFNKNPHSASFNSHTMKHQNGFKIVVRKASKLNRRANFSRTRCEDSLQSLLHPWGGRIILGLDQQVHLLWMRRSEHLVKHVLFRKRYYLAQKCDVFTLFLTPQQGFIDVLSGG